MKKNLLKLFAIAALLIFIGAGVSLADGDRGHHRGHAYGHYPQRIHHHYHYAPPRPVYVEHHYRPVVVERHYYPAPVYYAAPSGFFFGMSVADAGSAFSFGMSGR
jgi:hypothetical protein